MYYGRNKTKLVYQSLGHIRETMDNGDGWLIRAFKKGLENLVIYIHNAIRVVL
jgi:hypothetical protein